MLKIGALVSGGCTNLQSIIDSMEGGRLNASITAVVSDNPDAYALERACRHGIKTEVLAAIVTMRRTVAEGLPFHLPERLGELDTLSSQLAGGSLTPAAAAARLWAFIEDELRLSRENGLDRQVVEVDGAEVLADVARLGMVALYFRSEGGVMGMVSQNGAAWRWQRLDDRDDQVAIELLFEKLKHGVRTGAFVLPNPYAGASR